MVVSVVLNFPPRDGRLTGRWQQTPFRGTIEHTADAFRAVMQHLVANY
jgi:hypothetical protein